MADSAAFDATYYLAQNPDVALAIQNGLFGSSGVAGAALEHYELYGAKEGRAPNAEFNAAYYLANNPDVAAWAEATHPGDVLLAAFQHYEEFGVREGRLSSAAEYAFKQAFDEAAYDAANPDVAAAIRAGLITSGYEHYQLYGEAEGRVATNASGQTIDPVTGATPQSPPVSPPPPPVSPPPPVIDTLTTGVDNGANFTGSAIGDNVFNSVQASGVATFTALDALNGGGGPNNVLNITGSGTATLLNTNAATGATVTGIQTANLANNAAITADTSTWTGLTTLNVTGAGSEFINAAATTNVTATDTLAAVSVDGGLAVSVTTSGGNVTIGTYAPAGAVTLTETATAGHNIRIFGGTSIEATVTGVTTGGTLAFGSAITTGAITATVTDANNSLTNATGSAITVHGGTTIDLTHNITAAATGVGSNTSTGGTITINGSALTTEVTVNQTAAVAATGVAGAAGQTENGTLYFQGISIGQSVTVAGLTFTSTDGHGYTAVADAFANLSAGATTGGGTAHGTYSGTLTGFNTGPDESYGDITFTSVTPDANVPDLTYSSTANNIMPDGYAQGRASVSGATGSGGIGDGAVHVADANAGSATAAATIASVTLSNFGAGTSISSNALTSLTLSGVGVGVLTLTEGLTTPTNTTLALTLGGGTFAGITDSSAQFETLNVVLTASTTLGAFTDSALTTLAVSGTGVFTFTDNAALTSITATGAVGLNTDLSVASLDTSFAFSNTGVNTVTLNAGTQAYSDTAGKSVVTISTDALMTITGNGSSELVLGANATAFTAGDTVANATGFTTLGVNGASQGSYDLAVLTGFNAIDVQGVAGVTTFSNVTVGTDLTIDGATGSAISYLTSDMNGASDAVTVTLRGVSGASGTAGYITDSITFEDAIGVGLGTVNIVTDATATAGLDTIATFVDPNLGTLNVTGTGNLSIGGDTTSVTSLTITDNGTGTAATVDTISGTLTAASLGTFDYSGTHSFSIGTLVDGVANATITNANTGTTGGLTIGSWTDNNIVNLNLNGSIALTSATFGNTVSETISGATDNSAVSITVGTASTTNTGTDTITLGNGANQITDLAQAASVTVSVGTGANAISVAGGTLTGVYNIMLGTHNAATGSDTISVSEIGSGAQSTAGTYTANTIISGAAAGDLINFNDAAGLIVPVTLSAPQLATFAGKSSLNDAILFAHTITGANHGLVAFQYGGNEYLVEDVAANTAAVTSGVVELIGVHTVGATATNGQISILS